MPTPPDDIVKADLVFPSEFESQEPVPLRRCQLLPVHYGHALEQLCQVVVNEFVCFGGSRALEQACHGSGSEKVLSNLETLETGLTRKPLVKVNESKIKYTN